MRFATMLLLQPLDEPVNKKDLKFFYMKDLETFQLIFMERCLGVPGI